MILGTFFNDFINLFYPKLCAACGKGLMRQENVVCATCLMELRKTNYHLDVENPVSQMFWGRVMVQNATAFYFFNKGSKFRKLIHKLKYTGEKEIGYELGRHLGGVLKNAEVFKDVEVIIPVPLHPKREKKRGYNQSDWIGKGLAEAMEIKMDSKNLYRAVSNVTQTQKSRDERWENVASIFKLKNTKALEGKHVLLIDDVVTTGSTLEACAASLLEVEGLKVSIATLAVAN